MPPELANEEVEDGTFEDLDSIGENSEVNDDIIFDDPGAWDKPLEAPKGTKKSTDQVDNLEVEEGDIDGDGSKVKKKPDEELTDEELEEKETAAKAKPEVEAEEDPTPVGKLIKATVGDRETLIDDATTVRQKVDGKMTDVKISDALREYTGKLAVDRRLKEVAEERKGLTSKAREVQQYEKKLQGSYSKVKDLAKQALEGKVDAFAPMKTLLDILGEDSFVYYKKTMESLFADFESLYDMDENQQKAFWTSKENAHLREREASTRISQQREQENQKVLSQVESAHQEFGVDWPEFNEALDELLSFKDEEGKPVYSEKTLMNNPRGVAQYAARKPHITKAEALIQPFKDNIDDSDLVNLTAEVVNILVQSKGADEAEVQEWLETNYGVSPSVKALNRRLQKSGGASKKRDAEESKYKVKTKPKSEDEVEDWDDLDD